MEHFHTNYRREELEPALVTNFHMNGKSFDIVLPTCLIHVCHAKRMLLPTFRDGWDFNYFRFNNDEYMLGVQNLMNPADYVSRTSCQLHSTE